MIAAPVAPAKPPVIDVPKDDSGRRVYTFRLCDEAEESPTSPNIVNFSSRRSTSLEGGQSGRSGRRSLVVDFPGTWEEAEKETGPEAELKQLINNLTCEQTILMIQNRMVAIKERHKKNPDRFIDPSPAWKTLLRLLEMFACANYLITKSCHLLRIKNPKPAKPAAGGPSDAEDALSQISWNLNKINVNATALTAMLTKYVDTPVPEDHTALISQNGTVVIVEDGRVGTSDAVPVLEFLEGKLDMEQLKALPQHMNEIMSELNSLSRSANPVTSVKGAAAVILAAIRWKRKATRGSGTKETTA
eukprot:GEMP01049652.1.p1 GENE.GEMP01049652.1~~GEMP01049652.1.p1  ORF type:complete len:303 (+),score=64.46 GEMP01049652.1:242-1150(+)